MYNTNKSINDTIILHRSLGSPYSEKAMLMLRYVGLDWLSIETPKGIPRPIQEALVGNYSRRVPILQIGADLFCDTSMIMEKISTLSEDRSLSPTNGNAQTQELIELIESDGTLSMLGVLTPWNYIYSYFKILPFSEALEFIKDRKKLADKHPELKNRKSREEWMVIAKSYLSQLNDCLSNSLYLSSNDKPTASDFSAYTMIWYHDILTNLKYVKEFKNLMAWYHRMLSLNNKHMEEISPELSIEVAKASKPAPIPESMTDSSRIGQIIEVPINDSLGTVICQPISGLLVGENNHNYIIKREHESVGVVHIHIPKHCLGACG